MSTRAGRDSHTVTILKWQNSAGFQDSTTFTSADAATSLAWLDNAYLTTALAVGLQQRYDLFIDAHFIVSSTEGGEKQSIQISLIWIVLLKSREA